MRVLSNLLAFAFDAVEAKPKAVNLQLINSKVTYLGSGPEPLQDLPSFKHPVSETAH